MKRYEFTDTSDGFEEYSFMDENNNGHYVLYEDHLEAMNAKQATIDMLMMEYCPDEMTEEQIEEWGKRQVRVHLDIPTVLEAEK